MRFIRTNHSIYWLALILAVIAWVTYTPRVALAFGVAAVVMTFAGFVIRYRPR